MADFDPMVARYRGLLYDKSERAIPDHVHPMIHPHLVEEHLHRCGVDRLGDACCNNRTRTGHDCAAGGLYQSEL